MKVLKNILIFSLFLVFTTSLVAQNELDNEPKASLNSGTIESQFNYLYKKSGTYQDYKVVKRTFFYKIKANVIDSLKSLKKELEDTKQLVSTQGNEINDLKTDLKTTNDNLIGVTEEKNSIKFLGMSLTKTAYNSVLWSIIIGLLLFLLFFIFKFKNSNTITKQANQTLLETEDEFTAFKTVSLEREQKVRRELQDEINKQKSTKTSKK